MIAWSILLISVIVQINVYHVLCSSDVWVSMLTAKDVESRVLGSKDVWLLGASMVNNQAETEEFLVTLGNVLNKVQQYNVHVGYVDCMMKAHTKMCQGISPALTNQKLSLALLYDQPQPNPYTKKYFRESVIYTDNPNDPRKIEKFFAKNFNPKNFKMTDKSIVNIDEDLQAISKPTLVIVAEPEKSFKNIIYKTVAQNVSSIDVRAYKSSKPIASSRIVIESDKTAAHLLFPDKNEVESFTGDSSSHSAIIEWVRKFVKADDNGSSSEDIDDPDVDDNQIKGSSLIYTPSNLTESSVNYDEEWIIAVVKGSDTSKDWRKVENSVGGPVKAAKLLCSSLSASISTLGDKLCSASDEDYIVVIPYGLSARKKFLNGDKSKWTIFSSNSIAAAIKAIGTTLPESSVEIINERIMNEVMKKTVSQDRLPAFYIPDTSSEELTIPPSIIHVAMTMSKYIELVVISNPSKQFLTQIGGKPPMVVCMLPEIVDTSEEGSEVALKPVVFDPRFHGALKYRTLYLFFRRNYVSSTFGKNAAADDLFREETSSTAPGKMPIVEVSNNATWYKACPPSFRGVCVIHLTSKDSGYSDKYLAAVANGGSLASSVALIHIDGECKLPFTEQFGISSTNLPTFVIYAPFKERYALFRGSLSEVSVADFVTSVLTGKSSTLPISQRPSINDDCVVAAAMDQDPVVEEDASDFLAEILAEEKAKAEAVKQAAADEAKRLAEEKKNGSKKPKGDKKKKKKKKVKADEEDEL